MFEDNAGKSAFPREFQSGLTKREWFFGMALKGLLANPDIIAEYRSDPNQPQPPLFVKEALRIADAALKELS
jgi:hypothetical protein